MVQLIEVTGIGETTAKKLIDAGVITVDQLSVMNPMELRATLGITLKSAKEMINSAKDKMVTDAMVYDADSFDEMLKRTIRYVKSGSRGLDEILGGGFRSMSTHGIFGEFTTGKTQFCNTAMANAIDQGWDVCFVETEPNTFSKDRLEQICTNRQFKYDGSKVHIYPATQVGTVFAQFRGYEFMWNLAEKNGWNVALFIVDSFNAKFRRAYAGREMYPERAQEFGRHLDYIEEFAKKFNTAVLMTFQVGITPEIGGQQGDQMRYNIENYPVGGTLVQHNVNTWISLNQAKGGTKSLNVYESHLVDSSYLPKATCQFTINERGVEDF